MPTYANWRGRALHQSNDEGYAAMTALILCAALSVICAGVLALSQQDRKRAARALDEVRRAEMMNEALLRLSAEVLASQGEDRLERSMDVGDKPVMLVAENEAVKWPMEKLDEVTPVALAHRTRAVTTSDLKTMMNSRSDARLNRPVNDCFRQLLSPFGYSTITDERPRGASGGLLGSMARDGQVWRLRATAGHQVEEQLVRFTGDPKQPYAVIVDEKLSLTEDPRCSDG